MLVLLAVGVFLFQSQPPSTAPTVVARDTQAVTLLQKSVASLAPTLPTDSNESGSITILAGSKTTMGTVQVLTRGSGQTAIKFETSESTWSVIFSNGQANHVDSSASTSLPLELAASSRCLYFPLPYLLSVLNNPDFAIRYIGQEVVGTATTNHIHVQNTFNSSPLLQALSEFNFADIWLDATSELPVKISMVRRYTGGFNPQIPISFVYSNYQTSNGVQYPQTIQEYWTETLWATTTIETAAFNIGLTDSNFPVTTTEAN